MSITETEQLEIAMRAINAKDATIRRLEAEYSEDVEYVPKLKQRIAELEAALENIMGHPIVLEGDNPIEIAQWFVEIAEKALGRTP